MDGNQLGNLAYLVILGVAVGSWFFVSNRQSLGKTAQQAAIWGLIFLGAIAAYGLWGDISRSVTGRATVLADEGRVVIPQSSDGHYYLTMRVNGALIDFVVDTGATQVVLSKEDAAKVGLDPEGLAYVGTAQTANGIVNTAFVSLDEMALGEITDVSVPAVVNNAPMNGSLLGMSYLERWDTIQLSGGQMVLVR